MELRINYDRVLKEGCRKTADLTSALDVATQRSQQHRPAVEVTSLEDFPNKPDNAAGPSALGRQQAANNLNSRIANKELSSMLNAQRIQAQTMNQLPLRKTRDIKFLNNTFKPFSSSGK